MNIDINSRDRHGWSIVVKFFLSFIFNSCSLQIHVNFLSQKHVAISRCGENSDESNEDILKVLLHYHGIDLMGGNNDKNTPLVKFLFFETNFLNVFNKISKKHFFAQTLSVSSWEEIGNLILTKGIFFCF